MSRSHSYARWSIWRASRVQVPFITPIIVQWKEVGRPELGPLPAINTVSVVGVVGIYQCENSDRGRDRQITRRAPTSAIWQVFCAIIKSERRTSVFIIIFVITCCCSKSRKENQMCCNKNRGENNYNAIVVIARIKIRCAVCLFKYRTDIWKVSFFISFEKTIIFHDFHSKIKNWLIKIGKL